jgi:hypothetical protein
VASASPKPLAESPTDERRMNLAAEIEDVRFDIEALRTLIDRSLDAGTSTDDITLRALSDTLHTRVARLKQLERAADNAG